MTPLDMCARLGIHHIEYIPQEANYFVSYNIDRAMMTVCWHKNLYHDCMRSRYCANEQVELEETVMTLM